MRHTSFSSALSGALTDLVGLALRSQYELARLMGPVTEETSSRYRVYEFTVHDGIAGALVHCELDNQGEFTIRATQAGRTYEAKLPFKGESVADIKAAVKLSEQELVLDTKLDGEAFLTGEGIPDTFRALHHLVIRHARRNLSWMKKGMTTSAREQFDAADQAPLPEQVSQAEHAVSQLFKSVTAHAKFAQDALFKGEPGNPASHTDEVQEVRVGRTNEPDLQFKGKLLAHVRSPERNGRFWAYSVFETVGGNLVAVREGFSRLMGEAKRSDALVTKNRQELIPFFGSSPLARALYAKLGVDHVTFVD